MHYTRTLLWLFLFFLCVGKANPQLIKRPLPSRQKITGNILRIDDTTYLAIHVGGGACKNYLLQMEYRKPFRRGPVPSGDFTTKPFPVHGDLTYDFLYRSAIDTPFAGSSIQQQTLRANFNVRLLNKLPVQVHLNSRRTNSPYFKNYTDVNFEFDQRQYNELMQARVKENILRDIRKRYADSILVNDVRIQEVAVLKQREWLEDARQLQALIKHRALATIPDSAVNKAGNRFTVDSVVNQNIELADKYKEVKERDLNAGRFLKKLPGTPAYEYVCKDSVYLYRKAMDSIENLRQRAAEFIALYKKRQVQYEEAKEKLTELKDKYESSKTLLNSKIDSVSQVFTSGSKKEISSLVKKYGQDTGSAYKWYRRISSIEKFSVGRSMIDFSELSARNISINGIQAMYMSRYSVAVASGSVDYLYRDFLIRNLSPVKQYLNLVQVGRGEQRGNNIFVTVYQGKKQGNTYDSSGRSVMNKVFGITLGGKFRIDDNNYLLAELAKSSYPFNVAPGFPAGNNSKTFSFSNHSNEAYTLQLFSRIPKTGTRIYGMYRKLGRNFQSFSIFNLNSDLVSWQVKVDQYFLRRQLLIAAALRTNDYSTPYPVNNFKSNTIFKSLQLTLRKKKWPVLSVSYMPSSQVTSIGDKVIENRFYTLMGTAAYVYKVRRKFMNTGLVYTRYYNRAVDSGFIYYNARNWFVYHNIMGEIVSFNSAATFSYNTGYQLLTLDAGLTGKVNNRLSAGGGLKWNILNGTDSRPGYYGNMRWRPAKIGEFNISFDRGYIPGVVNRLRRNDVGRITYIKIF